MNESYADFIGNLGKRNVYCLEARIQLQVSVTAQRFDAILLKDSFLPKNKTDGHSNNFSLGF